MSYWLNGFAKRITVLGALLLPGGSASTDIQCLFTVKRAAYPTAPATPAPGEIYVGTSGCETDYRDIRFTDTSGNKLPYWIESYDSSSALVWVRLPGTGVAIYCYYGNTNAVSESDGNRTFELFDHFLGSAYQSSLWTVTNVGNLSISASIATFTGNSSTYPYLNSINTYGQGYAVRGYYKYSDTTSGANMQVGFKTPVTGTKYAMTISSTGGNIIAKCYNSGVSSQNISCDTNYHIFDICRNGSSNVLFYKDGTLAVTETSQIPDDSEMIQLIAASTGYNLLVDWILVRKYNCYMVPGWSSNSEETLPTQTTAFPLQRGGHDYES